MAIAGKIDALLERAYTEGDRQLNEAYGRLLTEDSTWQQICSVFPTNSERVDMTMMLDVPEYVEEVGGVSFNDLKAKNYVVTPRWFSAGIKMHEDDINDDMLGIVIARIRDLGRAPNYAFRKQVFSCLKAGVSVGTYGACYDDGAFFATHTNDAGTFDNYDTSVGGATAWYLLDCSDPSYKPLGLAVRKDPIFSMEDPSSSHRFETREIRWKVEGKMWPFYGLWQRAFASTNTLTDTMIWTGIQTMRGFKDNSGRYLSTGPTHLCVAPDTEKTAREVLERMGLAVSVAGTVTDYVGGVTNEPIRNLGLKLIVDPHLA